VEFPASPKQLEEALERLYKGQTNVAVQAQGLGMPLERLKQIFTAYVVARPIDINDEELDRTHTISQQPQDYPSPQDSKIAASKINIAGTLTATSSHIL
jgi:hypothetical protein|tara:strand:- start:926 stop:1222 length:297 start_codon:yes stop_codon:yes gene_type:complete